MLIQQENEKMKERDDQYSQQVKDWRVQISQRKKVHTYIHTLDNSLMIKLYTGIGGRIYNSEEEFTGILQ